MIGNLILENLTEKPFVRIPLTKGKFAIIDAEDADYVNQWKWTTCSNGHGGFYAYRKVSWQNMKFQKCVMLHRVLFGLMLPPPPEVEVDHKNHDGLDCRKSNLRIATRAQNARNLRKRKNKTSKYTGVSLRPDGKAWIAQIKINGVRQHLGSFKSEEGAAEAYQLAVSAHYEGFKPDD